MIWIIGEYAERIDNASELLESFLEGFQDENSQVCTLWKAMVIGRVYTLIALWISPDSCKLDSSYISVKSETDFSWRTVKLFSVSRMCWCFFKTTVNVHV